MSNIMLSENTLVEINAELQAGYDPEVIYSRDESLITRRALREMQYRFYNIATILRGNFAAVQIIDALELPEEV